MKCAVCHRDLAIVQFRLRHDGRRKSICLSCENSVLQKNNISRRCHDCGTPTNNYRCHRCWSRLRSGDPSAKGIDPQYLP